ncbi:tetratricopeptide repeat protein [Hydrocarboniclastica marina]|uniref:Uncharacterized protein n=1 Tax=Hydrocarboniclastica marina TaxID=2259620 RepID=A0A4P7XFS4_9ALTE|nr:hypothetical protein [Hydrocarboniclastica marina]QCF24982.1 hypothetical protein soil367_02960 [Hydrocarboniclastica marina]
MMSRSWLLSLLLPAMAAAQQPMGPSVSQPEPEAVILHLDESTKSFQPDSALLSPEKTAEQVLRYINSSRATGSPRPLGLAQGLLNQIPETRWSSRLYLLRATLHQRLHRFDEAQADLDRVLDAQPNNRQALLTRYSIALTQGDLGRAEGACRRLGQIKPGLLADTCRLELEGFGDQPERAFGALSQRIAQARGESRVILDWARVTLADMASRHGLAGAGRYWARALQSDSKDLYRRARFADWLLAQGRPNAALAMTHGYEDVDPLAVLRAIAMTRLDHPQRDELVRSLAARFEEARWRGEFLHEWEYGRFLLDVTGEPTLALTMAKSNWATQRAYPDRQLLVRAAQAAGDQAILKSVQINSAAVGGRGLIGDE